MFNGLIHLSVQVSCQIVPHIAGTIHLQNPFLKTNKNTKPKHNQKSLHRQERALSLGRVDPAPHTQHLLGPFEAIAQNSLLRSFSIVDSLANRQHSCRGSEELAIRFQATPNYFAAL